MKFLSNYLKFNESIDNQFFKTKEEIKDWLYKMGTKVGKYFNCAENNLTSLEYGPKIVDGYYYCYNNNILNLKGCSQNLKYERCDDFMGEEKILNI